MNKLWVIGIIVLFVTMSIVPTSGNPALNDDTTPPVSTHTLDPTEPDGKAGWYVSNVTVTMNAIDDISGVKEIRYTVNGKPGTIPGDHGTFTITEEGDNIPVEYWAIDNAGNIEIPHNMFYIDIDKTKPNISAKWDVYSYSCIWHVKFTITATDNTGIIVIKMYINEGFHKEVVGGGPVYEFDFEWFNDFKNLTLRFEAHDGAGNTGSVIISSNSFVFPSFPYFFGFIYNPEISEENVTFFTLLVLSNYDGIHMFKRFTFPNDYIGYIGRFFISAKFCNWYDWPPI